jgi:hypothetical protein
MITSKFFDPVTTTLAVKEVRPVDGAAGLSTLIAPNDRTVSCQEDGSLQERPTNFDGLFERCRVSGNLATWQPKPGTFYTRAFVMVDAL